ncbi:CLUMA_CG009519, isoform A [Clunio marinus]|uniref:CLUMA_CG009514, isoform A n=1 Tax=Clunio marinus TaxID=568069 RepID=A0A1J1IAT7_9DIPT|nr:CLUMA_CG009514, isoform A [Clunio marinus]CRK96083.1 CLUMA_CG009519, isoform A [Clunio marinus]
MFNKQEKSSFTICCEIFLEIAYQLSNLNIATPTFLTESADSINETFRSHYEAIKIESKTLLERKLNNKTSDYIL